MFFVSFGKALLRVFLKKNVIITIHLEKCICDKKKMIGNMLKESFGKFYWKNALPNGYSFLLNPVTSGKKGSQLSCRIIVCCWNIINLTLSAALLVIIWFSPLSFSSPLSFHHNLGYSTFFFLFWILWYISQFDGSLCEDMRFLNVVNYPSFDCLKLHLYNI